MNNRRLLLFLSFSALFATLFISGCKEEEDPIAVPKLVSAYSSKAPVAWNKLFLKIERYAAGYRPGPATRALGYMGLACYEACITGMPGYNSLENHFTGLNIPDVQPRVEYHWPTVVHAVYTTMMPKFFTEAPPSDVVNEWNDLVGDLNALYRNEAGEVVFSRSLAYGESVGNAVWEWSVTDPYGHEAYKNPFGNYTTNENYDWSAHYDGPGDWEPTFPGPKSPICPFFGKARIFALEDSNKLSLPPSYYSMEYSEDVHSEYYAEALQAYTSSGAVDYNTEGIGVFWSDDFVDVTFSYGPRWISIANQIIEKDGIPLDKALEANAKTGMAINDAAVACFYSKFEYNVERPVTYIKKFIDPSYKTSLKNPITGEAGFNPPYPSFPSGHATMGSAGAEVLESVFGYKYAMTDNSHLGRTEFESTPRTYGSLREMALENAWSRLVLGTNWFMDGLEGDRFGKSIGQKVNALPWKN